MRLPMRRKARAFPGRFDLAPLRAIRTIRQFDDAYTAPSHGFGTAANYYAQASARRVIDRITIPALILVAEDDPFVPISQFQGDDVRANPQVHVSIQRHGGHCGFIGPAMPDSDGYWAETAAVNFVTTTALASRP